MATRLARSTSKVHSAKTLAFAAANIDSVFEVLDAVAWLNAPTCKEVAQFAGVDPRTAGKLLKNAVMLGLVECVHDEVYLPVLPYPYKGTLEQKKAVVREALMRLPYLKSVRQFLQLGDGVENALRKAATVVGVSNYDPSSVSPLVSWAKSLDALAPGADMEDLLNSASRAKALRRKSDAAKRVAFISHSSEDKPFVRRLAGDLTAAGVGIWLDEQRIHVGDSIPELIAQGLAESDVFLLVLSEKSVASPWVQRELNSALVKEITKRNVKIVPVRLTHCDIPPIISDKKYADFVGQPYREAFDQLLQAIQQMD